MTEFMCDNAGEETRTGHIRFRETADIEIMSGGRFAELDYNGRSRTLEVPRHLPSIAPLGGLSVGRPIVGGMIERMSNSWSKNSMQYRTLGRYRRQ